MKRLPLLLSLLLLLPSAACAVSFEGLGVKAGWSVYQPDFQYEGQKLFEPDAVMGATGGVSAEWGLRRRSGLNLITELLYIRKGYEGDDNGRAVDVKATYLSVPLLLKPSLAGDLKIYVFAGPSLEILLKHDDEPVFDDYRKLGLAANVGLGLNIEGPGAKYLIELRFVADLTDAGDAEDPLQSVKHRGLLAVVGVGF